MSWNIGIGALNPLVEWPVDSFDRLKVRNFDVCCFQEVGPITKTKCVDVGFLKEFATANNFYLLESLRNEYSIVTLVKKDFKIIGHTVLQFNQDYIFAQGCTLSKYDIDDHFTVWNVHLKCGQTCQKARESQQDEIIRRSANGDVICGDFNEDTRTGVVTCYHAKSSAYDSIARIIDGKPIHNAAGWINEIELNPPDGASHWHLPIKWYYEFE